MGEKVRGKGLSRIVALVGLAFAMAGPAAAAAGAETLVDQPPGPSGVAVRSDDSSEWNEAFDDFDVPPGTHLRPEAIRVFGKGASDHPRTFNVKIIRGDGASLPFDLPDRRVFGERVTVAGGPDYLIPLHGVPRLDRGNGNNYENGQYWISVQAVSTSGEDDWSWLTGPSAAGIAPAFLVGHDSNVPEAEPGLAFQLLGTVTQVVKARTSGAGTIVSNPPGISCPGTCVAEFARGTALTFTQNVTTPSSKFIEWGFRDTGFMGPPNGLVPIQIPSPCGGTGGCAFTLTKDTDVGAVFEPINEVTVLRVVRDRRLGRGDLLVWAPGEGVLSMISPGLKSYRPGTVAAGLVRIPLIPTKPIAKTVRRKGRATVSAEVDFRPIGVAGHGKTQLPVTLVRKRPGTHSPTHR